jgi:uncharacterized protein YjiS (DUF1127 family)
MHFLHSGIDLLSIVQSQQDPILQATETNKRSEDTEMAYTQTTRATIAPAGGRSASLFGGIAERVRRYRVYRQTLAELEALSSRELADLGIHHSMIRSLAYQAAYED